ncbi:DUF4153 domain-containing protein [Amantichitinum ursilacus]|uniref:DUF4153 domain-containing protein n=1 Tax=Amantichitinum ursilacus TaxID=857265 RepID=A0A0N1JTB9_9NEIS|nr:DUF4153 domain-containing protein [Amantichitinum ursilacus]KPC54238.1 hypothetical protein WG78_06300 [Amantichitinum ursilacus]
MLNTDVTFDGPLAEASTSRRNAVIRLLLGGVQGILLYGLYQASTAQVWPATAEYLFSPLVLLAFAIPLQLISSLGHLPRRVLAPWVGITALILIGAGCYAVWRSPCALEVTTVCSQHTHYPTPWLVGLLIGVFYVGHSMVLAGARDQRWVAAYPSYFEMAWKLAIQILFSAGFTLVLWGTLWLGAELFALVGSALLQQVLSKGWVIFPLTALAFACGMELTDVRPGIIRGIRTLGLSLLSWLLPVATVLIAAFLLCLPAFGVDALWHTRHATQLLLVAALLLIVLLNAAFQNGVVYPELARIVRGSARLAAGLLAPVIALALYALHLRINQYGWTVERVGVAAALLVLSSYAAGYLWATAQRGPWQSRLARVNIVCALITVTTWLALLSPLVDPVRIEVDSQMARLAAGQVSAEAFDVNSLRFEGGRFGDAALRQLVRSTPNADLRRRASLALQSHSRYGDTSAPANDAVNWQANVTVWPRGQHLPASFSTMDWRKGSGALPMCLRLKDQPCDVFRLDTDGQGHPDMLVGGQFESLSLLRENSAGLWTVVGRLPYQTVGCAAWRQALRDGQYQVATVPQRVLRIGAAQMPLPDDAPTPECPANKK